METILKKLDLEDVLEKEKSLWYRSSTTNSSDISIDEINASNVPSKVSDNLLTNRISETIQNIKIKKQNDFYKSQILKNNVKNPKNKFSKINKTCLSKKSQTEIEFDEDSNEEDIFVSSSRKTINDISTTLSIAPLTTTSSTGKLSTNSSSSCKNETSHSMLDTGNMARLKLSAFQFNKKPSNTNSTQVELKNMAKSLAGQKKKRLSNIFSIEDDDDDLSYLDVID